MTVTAPRAAAGSPRARLRSGVRRWRAAAALVVVLGVLAVLTALGRPGSSPYLLDPADATPVGAHALAALLRARGLDIRRVTDPASAGSLHGATLLLVAPVSPAAAALVPAAARVVVVGADAVDLRTLHLPVGVSGGSGVAERAPRCALPLARLAGRVRLGGASYTAVGALACYGGRLGAPLLRTPGGPPEVTLLGDAAPMRDDGLARAGDAALAIGLLDASPRLVWVTQRPQLTASPAAQRGLLQLLPARLWWALLQLVVAAVLLAIWRARRFGPVVREPLPVVVRAAETVEGRAALYRASRSRGHAARTLRAAAEDRARRRCRLPADAPASAVVDAVSRRSGRPPAQVQDLLYRDADIDDRALVRLLDELDRLDEALR